MPRGSRLHTRSTVVAAIAAIAALALLGGCGRGEDRPGQVTTETPSGGPSSGSGSGSSSGAG